MVEHRSPKPEVVGSIPSAPAKLGKINMINPFKIYTRSQTTKPSEVTWPTGKRNIDRSSNGYFISCGCFHIFFNFGSNTQIFIEYCTNYKFLNYEKLVHSSGICEL